MDVDSDDDGVNADFGKANLAKLCHCVLPGELMVTIVDDGLSGQCQWAVLPLMRQLFSTKRDMKLRDNFRGKGSEVKDIHLLLWPGVIVPESAISKHEKEFEEGQAVFLKQKTMATSLAIAWMTWAVSKAKRMPPERARSQAFLRSLLNHVLEVAGTLSLRVVRAGQFDGQEISMRVSTRNPFFNSDNLWTRAIRGSIVHRWESRRVDENEEQVTSGHDRPHWIDFILFACDPHAGCSHLLVPLALQMLAQIAFWMDENMSRLALDVQVLQQNRQKNEFQSKFVLRQELTEAAEFMLRENATFSEQMAIYFPHFSTEIVCLFFQGCEYVLFGGSVLSPFLGGRGQDVFFTGNQFFSQGKPRADCAEAFG